MLGERPRTRVVQSATALLLAVCAVLLSLLDSTVEFLILWRGYINEFQIPILVILHSFHEGIRDSNRNIEIGYRILISFTFDKVIDIRVIHP